MCERERQGVEAHENQEREHGGAQRQTRLVFEKKTSRQETRVAEGAKSINNGNRFCLVETAPIC